MYLYIHTRSLYIISMIFKVLQEGTTLSPENIPSEPTFPRAFVEFSDALNKKDVFVTFRWNEPKVTNGVIEKYTVQYWFTENRTIQSSLVIISNITLLQYKAYDLKPDTMYYFKVQANNEFGAGPYTKLINVSTTHENPVPLLLIQSLENNYILDIDLQVAFEYNLYDFYDFIYSAFEHKIYAFTYDSKLVTFDFNPNAIETYQNYIKIANIDSFAYNLCIDWIRGDLYWIESDKTNAYIMKLDLILWQQTGVNTYDKIVQFSFEDSAYMRVLPYIGYLYWKDYTYDEYFIMQSDIAGKNINVLMKANNCSCKYKLHQCKIMQIDTTSIDKPLMYWIVENNLIVTDINGCNCNLILRAENQATFDFITIDSIYIYLVQYNGDILYILKKEYALLQSKENTFKRVEKIYFGDRFSTVAQTIIALDKTTQLYPPLCLIPNMKDYRVEEVFITANRINVKLPEPIFNDGCEMYNFAIIYNISVSYLTCPDNNSNKLEQFYVQTYERHYEFENLMPFTEYTLKLALINFYVHKLSMNLQFSSDVKLTTTGKLHAPDDVTVQVLMPTLAIVYWMPPKKLGCVVLNYEVHWVQYPNNTRENQSLFRFIKIIDKFENNGKFFTVIRSLIPKQKYKIYVRVYLTNFSHLFTDSLTKTVYMSEPNNLNQSGVSINSMNISWIPSVNLTIHNEFCFTLEYKNVALLKWKIANNSERNNDKITYYIENLLPQTSYKFRLNLKYNESEYKENFIWPSDGKEFTFETLGNVPNAPGIPTVTRLPNFVYQLRWEPAQADDLPVILYQLEGLTLESNYKEDNQATESEYWNLYYNGTDNYWLITKDMNQTYRFRVKAKNIYGFGVWSVLSAIVDLTKSIEIPIIQYFLPLILSLIAILVLCNVYYFYCSYRQRIESYEIVLSPGMITMELATLYEIPSENVQLNLLYAPKLQFNSNKLDLITIKKEQITLANFLGRGAFGKVFQGTLKNFEDSNITPIAIKMLRKNASSKEKKEFLQEAKLMNYFRHKNVLKLLGICLDADSPLLILELMEADLLSYLRKCRTLQSSDPHALRLQDLLAMCEDVARGCRYLEKLHFVHRDLACRNCLITARNRENRIVKIGDFGLAEDIYKDDYYRMKGEGLLPVRWMAPESLLDGIFTSQSDVWAFGVLMWEITSLGQQPYCARNNLEVCQYVCEGGKLPKPLNCPPMLYQLMLRCWNVANDRPNFTFCLENIVTLRSNIEDSMLSIVDIIGRTEVN